MRTQIAKSGYLTAEYIPLAFLTRGTLPIFRRFIVGAAIEKNFFHFSDFVLEFYFFQNPNFNSLSFTRHSSSASFCVRHVWIARFLILNLDSFLLVIFPSYLFRLVSALSILCFDSSTLYLFCLL